MRALNLFILTFLFLASAVNATAACGDTSLKRALFAMAVANHEPVDEVFTTPSSHDYLFFFVEVINGNGKSLQHRWYRNGELAASVNLAVGADRWRTWSRKFLGEDRNTQWRVDVVDDAGCTLASRTLSADGKLPVLEQAQSMLKSGDLVGARLLVKTEMANNLPYRKRLERFLDQDLALAQLEQQIEANQLYTAEARLSQLQALQLGRDHAMKVDALRARLDQKRSTLSKDMGLSLASATAVLRHSLNGGSCPNSDEAVSRMLSFMPNSEQLLVSAWARDKNVLDIDVIDQRTGMLHNLSLDCLSWQ